MLQCVIGILEADRWTETYGEVDLKSFTLVLKGLPVE